MKHVFKTLGLYILVFLLSLALTHCGGGGGDGSSGVSGSQNTASQERLDITALQDLF